MRALAVITAALVGLATLPARPARAAIACALNDPDRDIRRIFPDATGFRTEFITLAERGGEPLRTEIERRLGEKLDPIYDALDLSHAYYTVLKGTQVIGRVHGVNEKGKYGLMQLVLATDPAGAVVAFYYQKLSSPEAARFRSESFAAKFKGLTPADFYLLRGASDEDRARSRAGAITDPSEKSAQDFRATMRGIAKNLMLLDELVLARKYLKQIQEGNANVDKSK